VKLQPDSARPIQAPTDRFEIFEALSAPAALPGALCSILKTLYATLEFILDRVGPQPLDHSSVVVAVRQVVIQGRETVPLAGLLHFA
jgi:hypothetical protein